MQDLVYYALKLAFGQQRSRIVDHALWRTDGNQ